MTVFCRRFVAIVLVACALAGCRSELHSDLARGPAAYEAVAVSQSDTVSTLIQLQPRDQIDVRVFGEDNLNTEDAVIDQAGNVSLPLIGEMHAAGLSSAQFAKNVEDAYRTRYLRDPHVNVVLVKGAPRVISVEGEVKTPGVFEVQEGYTLLSALALAGSPLETSKPNEVLIFRMRDGQRVGGRFDVNDIRAGRAPDPVVLPGDVIVVGYSQVRGAFVDFLRTAPIIGSFSRY